jgi:hypothetical protein
MFYFSQILSRHHWKLDRAIHPTNRKQEYEKGMCKTDSDWSESKEDKVEAGKKKLGKDQVATLSSIQLKNEWQAFRLGCLSTSRAN